MKEHAKTHWKQRCALLAAIGLLLAPASASASCVVISADTDYQGAGFPSLASLVQHAVDTADTVCFDSSEGDIDLGSEGVLTLRKSVLLQSLEPRAPATLILKSVEVAADPGAAVDIALKNLRIEGKVVEFGCNSLNVAGCAIIASDPGAINHSLLGSALSCLGPVPGGIRVADSVIDASDVAAGAGPVIGLFASVPLVVEGCTIDADGNFAIGAAGSACNLVVRQNTITHCTVGVFTIFCGNLECSHNEITVDQVPSDGLVGGIGVFVWGNEEETQSVISQNSLHMETEMSLVFATGSEGMTTYNVTFKNNRADGTCFGVAGIAASHGCAVMNTRRDDLTLIERPDLLVTAEYQLFAGSTGNVILDNAKPPATIYEDVGSAGQNVLLGNLQHACGVKGNAARR